MIRENIILQWSLLVPGIALLGFAWHQLRAKHNDRSIVLNIGGSLLCIGSIVASLAGWVGLCILGIFVAILGFTAWAWIASVEEGIREREDMNK
jgi:hypothetical protein